MTADSRAKLLEHLASGGVSIRDVVNMSARDVGALNHLAASLFQAQKYEDAAAAFTSLEALEPDRPIHILHRAYSEARAGRRTEAIVSVSRYLDLERPRAIPDMIRAFFFRARLLAATRPKDAERDLVTAQVLGEQSQEGRNALAEAMR